MTELQQNRYDRLLRRVGGMIGPGSMVNDALTELFPMIDVESLNAELAFLADWRLAFGSETRAALAANNQHIQIFNPADTGMIVVLERFDVVSDTTQVIRYALSTIAIGVFTANLAMRDTRPNITDIPVTQVRGLSTIGGLALFGQMFLRADTIETMNEKKGLFVLAPGTGITFATTVVETTLNINFLWRERVAEASELAF